MAIPDHFPDILTMLSNGMGPDLHWFPEDISISVLATVLVGMANSGGGMVILGISPRAGEVLGIKDPESAMERVFQAAILIDPTLVLPMPQLMEVYKQDLSRPVSVVVITVPAGLPHVYSLDGRFLGREGTQSNPLSARRLYTLLHQRGTAQFESRLVADANLTDLNDSEVMSYAHGVGNTPLHDLKKSYEFLARRGCLKLAGDEWQLTNAALLLFGQYPQQWLPNATILAARFPGATFSGTYIKRDITGNLLEQLRQAEDFLQANLKTTVRLVGFRHEECLEYPLEAVRELLVNAIAHRDYNLQGDSTHLNIYSDRLEITSPGTLPGPVTLKNLLEARFARNSIISQVLSDLGYVERLGYGLDRVVEVTRSNGLLPPQFEEIAGTFRVTLFASQPGFTSNGRIIDLSAYNALALNDRQKLALAQLMSTPRISSHEYQLLCPDVHAETLRRDLAELVSLGVLIKIGDKKATYYILKKV